MAVDDSIPHAVLLDVGHGNAAVFVDGPSAIVVDAGSSGLVTDTLEQQGVTEISALVVSHRHHDHTSELPTLLANPDLPVRRLFLNADPNRRPESAFEQQLAGALNESIKAHGTEFNQANATLGPYMGTDRLQVEVLAPDGALALTSVGAPRDAGGNVPPHALAVVLRVSLPGERAVLFGSDLDHSGFRQLMEQVDVTADILVYPHHGGLSGAGSAEGEEAFATDLTVAVNPAVVVFSNGRSQAFPNPRREVVRGVLRARHPETTLRVVCTQLAHQCSLAALPADERLDPRLDSAGARGGLSCSGSLMVSFSRAEDPLPEGRRHLDFVLNRLGDGAMCVGEHLAIEAEQQAGSGQE